MPLVTCVQVGKWIPSKEITAIDGKPLPADADFFVKPPPEIGTVVSALSDVRQGQTLWPLPLKLALDLLLLAVAAIAIYWAKTHFPSNEKPGRAMLTMILGPICIAILALAFSFKKRWLGYIGTEGAAAFCTRGDRNAASGQWVRFADIADVQLVKTAQHKRSFDWKMTCIAKEGSTLFTLRGGSKQLGSRIINIGSTHPIATAIATQWKQRNASAGLSNAG